MKYLITKYLPAGPLVAMAFAASANAQTTKTTTVEKRQGYRDTDGNSRQLEI